MYFLATCQYLRRFEAFLTCLIQVSGHCFPYSVRSGIFSFSKRLKSVKINLDSIFFAISKQSILSSPSVRKPHFLWRLMNSHHSPDFVFLSVTLSMTAILPPPPAPKKERRPPDFAASSSSRKALT